MNFLDVSRAKGRKISRILIGSCNKPIELDVLNLSEKSLGEISVVDGKPSLHFLFYKEIEGKLIGVPNADYQHLVFEE
jgi:hypothetical protein